MNCEKCIHYKGCDLNRRLSGNTNSLMHDEECGLFKYKSLYIEQSEVEEIFVEIEEAVDNLDGAFLKGRIYELKKKYTKR